MTTERKYVNVILPLRLTSLMTYSVPDSLRHSIMCGSFLKVKIINKEYVAVAYRFPETPDIAPSKLKDIIEVVDTEPVSENELKYWEMLAEYYMCGIGEVYLSSARYIHRDDYIKKRKPKPGETQEIDQPSIPYIDIHQLTDGQQNALNQIHAAHAKGKTVLLNGVTGSGKTEIYIHLIKECLEGGQNALYMLPEVALSRQLGHRLEKVFGKSLWIYHSRQSIGKKKELFKLLVSQDNGAQKEPVVVLGLRSALSLPFQNLGLVVVDEEHDTSYKQSNIPRYNGRDAAIILAGIQDANVVLGSATPSLESQYNALSGKYAEILLQSRFNTAQETQVVVLDMLKERRKNNVKGPFCNVLLQEITKRFEKGEQVMIFRSRRAYSPVVQCTECGEIPKCPHCNIHLSYHKFNNSYCCHYCGYTRHFSACPSCGADAMKPLGAGTERIEEELRELLPQARIARLDSDTTKTKSEEERILKDFARRETDILVGTQMIAKGFDFENLTLVAVIQAESLTAIQDFRGDEKAYQLLTQLKGRAGRRDKPGMMIIQTSQADHPVFQMISGNNDLAEILTQRKEFSYPPFVRIINLSLRDIYQNRLKRTGAEVEKIIREVGIEDFIGPYIPPVDRTHGEYILNFMIRVSRNKKQTEVKHRLYEALLPYNKNLLIDVDPL